ncbi:GNAT family N-acetyltransferase [Bacillus massiliigorillae]|uniref:GNAT family N-acetyltransferase n=1 Tax=Bacillus massiliigorillae TaxID=1243664 RepID=UPI00039DBC28|nr:GNAT family N-acetyltransferase [Bacillus massiliigorillae]
MEVIVKPLYHLEDMEEMQQLEQHVWGMDFTPVHQTLTVAKNGGILLGGYINNQLIAFLYSFPGFDGDSVYLCSHMLGIHKDYRGQGIGEILKRKQREVALEKGYKLITWTFDPLESANANLNIRKLKGVCRTYMEDCYGKLEGHLNEGLATDRFLIEWHLESEHVLEQPSYSMRLATPVLLIAENEQGDPYIKGINDEAMNQLTTYDTLSVTVPTSFQAMKKDNFALAKEWRMHTRSVFQSLFANGFIIVDINRGQGKNVQQYILVKQSEVKINQQ